MNFFLIAATFSSFSVRGAFKKNFIANMWSLFFQILIFHPYRTRTCLERAWSHRRNRIFCSILFGLHFKICSSFFARRRGAQAKEVELGETAKDIIRSPFGLEVEFCLVEHLLWTGYPLVFIFDSTVTITSPVWTRHHIIPWTSWQIKLQPSSYLKSQNSLVSACLEKALLACSATIFKWK